MTSIRVRWLAALGVIAAALTGCATSSIADDSYRGFPSGSEMSFEDVESGVPAVVWTEGDSTFTVTVYGSSSCAALPTKVTAEGPTDVAIELAKSGGSACSGDLAATTYLIALPEDVDADANLRFTVVSGDNVFTDVRFPPAS